MSAHREDRRDRITGRLLRVWEESIGTSLTADAAVAATTLSVDDVSPFNDDGDGGWLQVGAQVIAYTTVDDDASTITLATAITTLVEDGEDVAVWNDLYDEVDTVQRAHVVVEGDDNNHDVIEAVVADTVSDLANGDRGKPRETVVLERDGDEWELIRVKGRPSKSRGHKYEADDTHTLTATDITAGTVTFPLTHRPLDESLKAWLGGVFQEPTEYTINYAAKTITWPLDGWESAGLRIAVHYAYRPALVSETVVIPDIFAMIADDSPVIFWKITEAAPTYADSGSLNIGAVAAGSGNAPTHNQASIYGSSSAGLGKSISWPGGAGTSRLTGSTGFTGAVYGTSTSGLTVVAVVQTSSASSGLIFGSRGDFYFDLSAGVPRFSHHDIALGNYTTPTAGVSSIADGQTHVLVGRARPDVGTNGIVELFVDGVLVSSILLTTSAPRYTGNNNLVMGYETTFNTFTGLIGMCAVIPTAVSDSRIADYAEAVL